MKANDDIVSAFHGFSAAMRIDLMCRLFHQCMPLEIRFLGTVLSELALKSYDALSPIENRINRLDYFGRLNTVHEDPRKVCVSLALLRNDNHSVATLLLRLLSAEGIMTECQKIGNLEHLEEYRLMYVMALYHPAFRFHDKLQQFSSHSKELEQLLDEKMSLWRTQGEAAGAETIMIKGPQVLPIPPEGTKLGSCEVVGAYKRISDKRFVYSILVTWTDGTSYTIYRPYGEFFTFQSKLLDLFPDEAGGKNKRARVIPFLPGKRFPFSSISSKEKAEKRFPEIVKYVRALMSLPGYITEHKHVRNFFEPHPQDHLLEETIFEKVKAVFDGVLDVDYSMAADRRSCTLNHEPQLTKTAKDRSKTFPSSTMAEQFLSPGKRNLLGTTTIEFTSNPLSPLSNPSSTPVPHSDTVHVENDVPTVSEQFPDNLPSIPENHINLHNHIGEQLSSGMDAPNHSLVSESMLLHRDDSGVNTLSSLSTPGITTRGVSSETTSTVSSMTSSPTTSPLTTPDIQKRSESCLTINTESQFTEESFVHWLKNHRLHKYAALFRGKTLEQILSMQVEDLRKGGMTVGATRKFQKKISEWRTQLAHSNPGSLQYTISRHPSTFSLPSYLVDRGGGITGSTSNQSLEQISSTLQRRRITSTTSSTSDVTGAEDSVLEVPQTHETPTDNMAVFPDSTSVPQVQQKTVMFKVDPSNLDEETLRGNTDKEATNGQSELQAPSKPQQPTQDGQPVGDPAWNSPLVYPAGPAPVFGGKRFNPTPVQIQLGNGAANTVNGQGQLEGVYGLGVPHQRGIPQPVQGGYGYYPRAIPVNNAHLLRMSTISTPNGAFVVLPQQQHFFSRPYTTPVVGSGFSVAQRPTCFKCGQFGHQGQECTTESMESFGAFHKSLGQQVSHSLQSPSPNEPPPGIESV